MTDADPPKPLTHAAGAPVEDNLNILTAGPRGPALLQDIWLIEKLAHFDREVIPERRMHAKSRIERASAPGARDRRVRVSGDIARFAEKRG